ncbi:MAG: hypothetical protein GYB66_08740 [Chloroflexi bacterium]|nr:hypothetical protein [Chloroflexota bacterium]
MRRDLLILSALALVVGSILLAVRDDPGYADAYYYYNAGERLANGHGLSEPYMWNFLHLSDELPAPSHTYWMPLASLIAAGGMILLGSTFSAAQLPFLFLLVGLVALSGWLGHRLGGSQRYFWLTGLLVLFGGFFFPFWLTTDTFALYGLVGAGALITMGLGREQGEWRWYLATGTLGGLAHLARSDGLLLVVVALIVIWWPRRGEKETGLPRWRSSAGLLLAYLLVMAPWFVRNMTVIESPLPTGGVNTAFLRGYNEIFAYPVDWSPQNFFAWGWGNIVDSRLEALGANFGTWLAVENYVLLGPFALVALWRQRHHKLLMGFMWYALGLHFAMTFVFAYPGYRGGLFHSSAALLPFWAALGVIGMDMGIARMAQWRNWKPQEARLVFGVAVVIIAIALSVNGLRTQLGRAPLDYDDRTQHLPDDAVIMVNNPAGWYYHTGLWGVTLPEAPLERVPEIAGRFCVTHLVIDQNVTESFKPLIEGNIAPPSFLEEIAHLNKDTEDADDDVRISRITARSGDSHCPFD